MPIDPFRAIPIVGDIVIQGLVDGGRKTLGMGVLFRVPKLVKEMEGLLGIRAFLKECGVHENSICFRVIHAICFVIKRKVSNIDYPLKTQGIYSAAVLYRHDKNDLCSIAWKHD